MFGNYLNILKLVFIWINLSLKLVLKKTNFKLVLFCSNFFYSILSLLITFFSLCTNLFFCLLTLWTARPHHPPLPIAIGRHWLQPTTAHCRWLQQAAAIFHRLPSTVTIHHRQLPPLATTIRHHRCHSPLSSIATVICHHQLPPFAAIDHHFLPSLTTTASHLSPLIAFDCHQLSKSTTASRRYQPPSLSLSTAVDRHNPPSLTATVYHRWLALSATICHR